MAGKHVKDLQEITQLSPEAQIIVVQDNLTQRTNVAEVMRLLTQPDVTTIYNIESVVTTETVQATVDASLEPYDSRITSNATAINTNSTNISGLDTRVGDLESSSSNWNTAFNWGNHAAQSYERTAFKGAANGYCGLDANSKIEDANLPLPFTGSQVNITADMLPTITNSMLPVLDLSKIPTLTADKIPLLTDAQIPDNYVTNENFYWQNIELTDNTDFDPMKEYRVTMLDADTSKTITVFPHKIKNTRLFFVDYYMPSDSKVSIKDYANKFGLKLI